jgi:hypothetical protein
MTLPAIPYSEAHAEVRRMVDKATPSASRSDPATGRLMTPHGQLAGPLDLDSTLYADPTADPGLARAVARGKALLAEGYGAEPDQVCPLCRSSEPNATRGGYCRHRAPAAERAQQRAWEAKAAETRLREQVRAGLIGTRGGVAPVVDWKVDTARRAAARELLNQLGGG